MPARRPALVWVIFAFYLLTTVASIVQVGSALADDTQRLDGRGRPYAPFDYLESFAFVGLKTSAAIMLFRLRRLAVPLFGGILVLNVAATGYDLLTKGLPPPGGPVTLVSLAIGFGILTAICLYAWRLRLKGILT